MTLDILTVGEALVEIMRTEIDQPLDRPGLFTGPYPSGAPFIFAVQAARMGAHVGAVGTVGDDAFGKCLLDQLETDSVSTAGVRKSPSQATGAAFIAYNADGTRNFVFSLGAGGELAPDMLPESMFEGLKCLHLMGSTLSMSDAALQTGQRAVTMAKAAGAKFSFDPNLRPELMPPEQARDAFAPFLAAADVLIPTSEELTLLTGTATLADAIETLRAEKPERLIIVTRGADGCTVYDESGQTDVPGFAVEEVDPTGAGDCFDAGFLVRWLAGDALATAARWANACGALAVTKQGPMAGAETYDAVQRFMAAQSQN